MTDWVEHAIWWHVYPLGFAGADTTGVDRSPGGGFDRLTGWLDHAVELGVNGLALGPINASGSHGYDTIDYHRIDSRLGDRASFDRLVAAARERGIRIMLDGVFNHVGQGFVDADPAREAWLRHDRGGEISTFEGHPGLLALDHGRLEVAEHVTRVMQYWLDAGADAWRLDAAYAVPPEFWAKVLPAVRQTHPDAYVMGEMLHGDYAEYVARSGVDAVTQYELWKAIWSSLASVNFFELDHALRRHDEFFDAFVPFTFIGNHDVTRLATAVTDQRHRAHALVLLMTLGGTPAVYYGDEFGALGTKQDRVGGDDAIRPAYPAAPGGPLPFDAADPEATLAVYRHMIGLRRRHPWLHGARTQTAALANESIVLRVADAEHAITVAVNLGDKDLAFAAADALDTLLAGSAEISGAKVRVPGHGWAVLA